VINVVDLEQIVEKTGDYQDIGNKTRLNSGSNISINIWSYWADSQSTFLGEVSKIKIGI